MRCEVCAPPTLYTTRSHSVPCANTRGSVPLRIVCGTAALHARCIQLAWRYSSWSEIQFSVPFRTLPEFLPSYSRKAGGACAAGCCCCSEKHTENKNCYRSFKPNQNYAVWQVLLAAAAGDRLQFADDEQRKEVVIMHAHRHNRNMKGRAL